MEPTNYVVAVLAGERTDMMYSGKSVVSNIGTEFISLV
jgi:hypothetical protein